MTLGQLGHQARALWAAMDRVARKVSGARAGAVKVVMGGLATEVGSRWYQTRPWQCNPPSPELSPARIPPSRRSDRHTSLHRRHRPPSLGLGQQLGVGLRVLPLKGRHTPAALPPADTTLRAPKPRI